MNCQYIYIASTTIEPGIITIAAGTADDVRKIIATPGTACNYAATVSNAEAIMCAVAAAFDFAKIDQNTFNLTPEQTIAALQLLPIKRIDPATF